MTASKPTPRRPSLEIDEDPGYQQWSWRMQRTGWVIFVALLVAATLGAFGSGLFSGATAGSRAEGLSVEYERFARLLAPSELVIHLDRRLVSGDRVQVLLGGDYVRAAQIESMTPWTTGGGATPDGAWLSFDVGGRAGDLRLILQIRFSKPGLINGRIGLRDGPMLNASHWIYP